MRYIDIENFEKETPTPLDGWVKMSEENRLENIRKAASHILDDVEFTKANDLGYVYLVLKNAMDAGERGEFLLNLESLLKKIVDPGITIWHEPIGDRNSLRKLRGIEIKS